MTKLVDRRKIREEYGVSLNIADKIFRELYLEKKIVRPEGMRRVFVYREDAERIIESWTT